MSLTRQDIWALGESWTPTTLWYAKGVRALAARDIKDRTSWRFLAAMHGIEEDLWKFFGYLQAGQGLPSAADQKKFWKQCQHQTWYFLPWHRGYVLAFEKIVRAAIVAEGGPSSWALPYWNYYNAKIKKCRQLPWCFRQAKLDDGSANPLFVTRRYGRDGKGNVLLDPKIDLDLKPAFDEADFAGQSIVPGFGGPQTKFHHGGEQDGLPSGLLESKPHNMVHSRVGGQMSGSGQNPPATKVGLMAMPDTAALDPVFWVHHANIDRLWEIWLRRAQSTGNPTVAAWLNGPSRKFVAPDPNGAEWVYAPKDVLVLGTAGLGYDYEDLTDPTAPAAHAAAVTAVRQASAMGAKKIKPELIGATSGPIRIATGPVRAAVHVDKVVGGAVAQALTAGPKASAAAAPGAKRERVFLNLENIKGLNDAAVLAVYVSAAKGSEADKAERLVGSVSLFGATKASDKEGPHAGNGLAAAIEITDAVRGPGGAALLDAKRLNVHLVPETEVAPEHKISIGRVSIYRTRG
jgi:tyrosinase